MGAWLCISMWREVPMNWLVLCSAGKEDPNYASYWWSCYWWHEIRIHVPLHFMTCHFTVHAISSLLGRHKYGWFCTDNKKYKVITLFAGDLYVPCDSSSGSLSLQVITSMLQLTFGGSYSFASQIVSLLKRLKWICELLLEYRPQYHSFLPQSSAILSSHKEKENSTRRIQYNS